MIKNNDKNNLKSKAVFRLLALFVYIQRYLFRRLSRNHNSSGSYICQFRLT